MVDDADFEWLSQWKWRAQVQEGTIYAVRGFNDRLGRPVTLGMHRVILGLTDTKVYGEHADGNGLNNTRGNLRACNKAQNQGNTNSRHGTSRFKGVYWSKKRAQWYASIRTNGRAHHLGSFENEEDAARQYNQASRIHYAEFSRYNDVTPMFPEKQWAPVIIVSSNTSGFRGVYFEKTKKMWRAQIVSKGNRKHIGYFVDAIDAALAYDMAARELFGDSAVLNFS